MELKNGQADILLNDIAQSATSGTLTGGNFGTPTTSIYLTFDYDVAAKYEVKLVTVAGANMTGMSHVSGADVAHTAGCKIGRMLNAEIIDDIKNSQLDGWNVLIAAGTRVGNTSFTVVGDVTDRIAVGDKIKLTDTTTKYYYVTAVAYTSTTLITVTGGSDYLVVGNPTNIYYSHGNAVGFPGWFNYTPTGISATNVALSGRFTLNNRTCKTNIYALFSGAITFTTMPTLPITASQSIIGTGQEIATKGTGSYTDTGASDNPNAISPTILASATVVNIRRSTDAVALSASVPITWANNDKFNVYFDYEI